VAALDTLPAAAADAAGARLLIIDDEQAQMRALCDTLGVEGYRARGHASARDALLALKPGEFDLLITDLMMPEMDGIAVSNAAREIDPGLAVIVMTGHGTVDTAVRAMQEGAVDYILKPFKLNAILASIGRALEMRRLRLECARIAELERQRSLELALANRDLESYSYSISHDLRAPLRAVSSFAEILEEDHAAALDEEGRRMLGLIRASSRTMDQLIVGLLEFSRANNGTRRLTMDVIDMTALADAAAREVATLHQGPAHRIDIGELPEATGDATVLRQVWCNLIGNALKYSAKKPEPRVTVTGSVLGGEAVYEVKDNGAGFDMRYADKLFGVFQRLHRSEEFAGAGVGLAIVQRIIARHGGRVWAEGKPGEGASFRFALPLSPHTDVERAADT
jgi:two-component system, sensor histidine kinase and response regulator